MRQKQTQHPNNTRSVREKTRKRQSFPIPVTAILLFVLMGVLLVYKTTSNNEQITPPNNVFDGALSETLPINTVVPGFNERIIKSDEDPEANRIVQGNTDETEWYLILVNKWNYNAIFFSACSDNFSMQNSITTAPTSLTATASPIIVEPNNDSLQRDVGYVHTEDDALIFEQTSEAKTNLPQEDVNPVYTVDIESIVVDITATNAYVVNVDSDSVLYQKNSDEHIAPASTAKMLTALTALDYFSIDDMLTVGSEIDLIASDSSGAGLNNGDTLTFKQLLVALLLPSGNDAAYTIAVNAGKRIAGEDGLKAQQAVKIFVNAMNKKAKEVGAASSNFTTPDGYDANGQYTTAFDLAQIAKVCLGNDALSKIMGSYQMSDTWMNGREVTYRNTNELINPNSQYYYANAVGLKTGTTGDAGSCLVSAAHINGQTYLCVVMGSTAGIRFSDSLTVFSAIDPTISLSQENSASSFAPGGMKRR